MATKESPPTGLLAKMASFVRSPSAEPAPQDKNDFPEGGESGKQAFKRMIERKAHNDSIRNREFSQLRKLRQVSPAVATQMVARDSFFQDSSGYSVTEERATTLKKIDEIEAQMSKQWWKGRPGGTPATSPEPNTAKATKGATAGGPAAKSPGVADRPSTVSESQLETCNTFAATLPSDLFEGADDVPTQLDADMTSVQEVAKKPAVPASVPSASRSGFESTGNSAFSVSKMVSIDMGQNLSDPTLEEAAIRFANSDDRGAESVLMTALQSQAGVTESAEAWTAALLDLYRGTGQRASFERLVQSQALESNLPAPVWFSTPEALGLMETPVGPIPEPKPTVALQEFWQCPAELDMEAVRQLHDYARAQTGSCRLDWRLLRSIQADAGQALAELFAHWCDQSLALQFKGVEVLGDVLRTHTPMGVSQVAPFWWQLRMTLWRIQGSQENFDLVAMDFCITYEVSPPAWQATRCQYDNVQETRWADADTDAAAPQGDTASQALSDRAAFPDARYADLFGEVLGTAADKLQPLQAVTQAGQDIIVNCDYLIRVDFSAAGNILNWVATAQAAGHQIELRHVPRLVAAFFNLIGINEHARVTLRLN